MTLKKKINEPNIIIFSNKESDVKSFFQKTELNYIYTYFVCNYAELKEALDNCQATVIFVELTIVGKTKTSQKEINRILKNKNDFKLIFIAKKRSVQNRLLSNRMGGHSLLTLPLKKNEIIGIVKQYVFYVITTTISKDAYLQYILSYTHSVILSAILI